MKTLKNLAWHVLSDDGVVSKRGFAGLCLMGTLIIISLANAFFGLQVTEFIFNGLLLAMLTVMGLTTATGITAITAKKKIAGDIIKEEPEVEASEKAKEIFQSDKPKG